MDELRDLVEKAEQEATLAEEDAARFLERERLARRTRLDEALQAVESAKRALAAGRVEVDKAARGELQTQARFELSAHSWRASQPPIRGLGVTEGTALCAFVLGLSIPGGGACLTAPLAMLVAIIGRYDA